MLPTLDALTLRDTIRTFGSLQDDVAIKQSGSLYLDGALKKIDSLRACGTLNGFGQLPLVGALVSRGLADFAQFRFHRPIGWSQQIHVAHVLNDVGHRWRLAGFRLPSHPLPVG